MLLDTKNASPPRRSYARHIEYLLVASLAAVTLMLLFAMGLFSPAAAAAVDFERVALTTRMIADGGQQLQIGRTAMLADRHILIGLTLLAIAVMAATTFSLWRWQVRGLILEARGRGR